MLNRFLTQAQYSVTETKTRNNCRTPVDCTHLADSGHPGDNLLAVAVIFQGPLSKKEIDFVIISQLITITLHYVRGSHKVWTWWEKVKRIRARHWLSIRCRTNWRELEKQKMECEAERGRWIRQEEGSKYTGWSRWKIVCSPLSHVARYSVFRTLCCPTLRCITGSVPKKLSKVAEYRTPSGRN